MTSEDVEALVIKIIDSEHAVDKGNDMPSKDGVEIYKNIFETIYQETSDKREAEILINKILNGPL